jgi:hypothetical protein
LKTKFAEYFVCKDKIYEKLLQTFTTPFSHDNISYFLQALINVVTPQLCLKQLNFVE